MGIVWITAVIVWAAAEASFFFILPDVLLTFIALRSGLRPALKLAGIAALTASLTGEAMWWWGRSDIWAARDAMLLVPAIGPDLLQRAAGEMTDALWPLHMITGAVTGVPYKLYAVEGGAAPVALLPFLFASFAARFLRFAGTVFLIEIGRRIFIRLGVEEYVYRGWMIAWLIVYVIYFSARGVI